jgi:membrane-associated phospholipid phosphatase
MSFKLFVRERRVFFILHTLLFLLGGYPLLVFEKVPLFLQLNNFHNPFFDCFFYYVNFLGSSVMYALLMIVFVVMQLDNRTLLIGLSSFVAMSCIVQGMKRIAFPDQLRPIALIPENMHLYLVEGIVPDTYLSFPSGHAATVFTAVCLVHLLARRKSAWCSVLLSFVAVIVAYSRVYVCQHFYQDVYVGAWIGTWATILVYFILTSWQGPDWLNQSLSAQLLSKRKHHTP